MAQGRFNWFDVTITVVSLLTLLLDVGTDVTVTVRLFLEGNTVWGSVLLALIVTPLVVMNAFSLKWHSTDGSLTCSTVLLHLFLLAPLVRYLRVLWLGFKACLTGHPRYTDAALREQNDTSVLRLFETFMESAPQLVVQLHLMLLAPGHIGWIQVLSASTSLVSMGWALTAYCETSRLNHQPAHPRRFLALCVHCLWQLFMLAARVTALVLFTSVLHAWLGLFAGLHWLMMTAWLWFKGTDFGQGAVERSVFRVASGFIYIFVYLNVHEGRSRGRMAPFYCLLLLENGVLFVVWLIYGKPAPDAKIGAAVIVFGGFFLGCVCLAVYYRWLHPSGPHCLFTVKSTLPTLQHHQVPLSSKDRGRYTHQLGHCPLQPPSPSLLQGSTLELSIEAEPPVTGSGRAGDSTAAHTLDSSTLEALESAWQSGMNCSDSSSTSSLDAEDCSLEDFNTTAKSNSSTLKDKSQSSQSTGQSQSSVVTIRSRHTDTASHPQASDDHSQTSRRSSTGKLTAHSRPSSSKLTSHRSKGRTVGKQSTAGTGSRCVSDMGHVSEAEEDDAGDSGEVSVAADVSSHGRRRSRISLSRSCLSPSHTDTPLALQPLLRHYHSSTVFATHTDSDASGADTRARASVHGSSTALSHQAASGLGSGVTHRVASLPNSNTVSPSNEVGCEDGASPTFDRGDSALGSLTFDRGDSALGTPTFDRGDSPLDSPACGGQLVEGRAVSQGAVFLSGDQEAMAPYPDLLEATSPDAAQQRLYLAPEDGYGERAGGESLWEASPSASSHSSEHARHRLVSPLGDQLVSPRGHQIVSPLGLQVVSPRGHGYPVVSPRGQIVSPLGHQVVSPRGCIDNESEPASVNARDLQAVHTPPLQSPQANESKDSYLEELKESFANESPAIAGPATDTLDTETSWSSMNVNENEWSGLNNLDALTPDDSLCSFASSDREEGGRGDGQCAKREVLGQDDRSSVISRASTPSLFRSRSTSSLCYEFASAGVSPSPPPGLKAARLSRNHSWVNSPDPSQPWQQPADTPWRLDYLNLDPAPPIERDAYASRNDPRELVIEMLMDQLKRTSLRSHHSRSQTARLSPLRMSHLLDSHPSLGGDSSILDWPAWRHLFAEDPDATLLGNPDTQSRGLYRNDIDLMRKALDLIEMQRFPQRAGSRTPDSESPEMYVSGQYRPPIITGGRETPQAVPPALRAQARRRSQSLLDQSARQPSPHSASLPRNSPGFALNHPHPHPHPPQGDDPRRRSMPAGQREGLYRYFVDSDSPVHTPLWTTPLSTPAATPSHRHLLHRYLTQNHMETGPQGGRAHSAEASSLRTPGAGERPVSVQPVAGQDGAMYGTGRLSERPLTTRDGARSRLAERPVTTHDYAMSRLSEQRVTTRDGARSRLSERLEVVIDVPDSGMHSDSHSAASRRHPLQSLDNSPSISPSSLTHTQQPIKHKPTPVPQPAAGARSSAGQRQQSRARSSAHSSGRSSQPTSHPASPKRASGRSTPQGRAYRQGMERGADGCSASQSQASSPQRSSAARARSTDRLR